MVKPDDTGPVRLRTDDLPERDRFATWREVYGRVIHQVEIEPLGGSVFQADLTLRSMHGVAVASGVSSAARYQSTPPLIAQSTDSIGLPIVLSGSGLIDQFGKETQVGPGETVVSSTVDPGSWSLPQGGAFTVLRVARELLAPLVPNLGSALGRRLPADTAALRLLVDYVKMFRTSELIDDPVLRHIVTTHIVDLAALAIGAGQDASEIAEQRGARAARLLTVKADIVENTGRFNMSIAALAVRHKLSPRHLHRLFEHEAVSLSEFVTDQRLSLTHRMLSDPRLAHLRISDIAFDAGFEDLSAFNRLFRKRFDGTPSEVRNRRRAAATSSGTPPFEVNPERIAT